MENSIINKSKILKLFPKIKISGNKIKVIKDVNKEISRNKKKEIPFQNILLRNNSSLINSYHEIKLLELLNLKKKLSIIKIKNNQTERIRDFNSRIKNEIFVNPFDSIFHDFKNKQYEKDITLSFEKRNKSNINKVYNNLILEKFNNNKIYKFKNILRYPNNKKEIKKIF